MTDTAKTHKEAIRLKALYDCKVLDTLPEKSFDNLTQLCAELLSVSMCAVSFIDGDRQWFKSKVGIPFNETPRDIALCNYVVIEEKNLIVEDFRKDSRFANHPLLSGIKKVCFYAGAPIRDEAGNVLGAFCVFDSQPRQLEEGQLKLLQSFAQQVGNLLEMRKVNNRLKDLLRQSRDIEKMSRTGGWSLAPKTGEVFWTEEVYNIHRVPVGTPTNKIEAIQFYAEHERPRLMKCIDDCIHLYKPYDEEFEFFDREGIHKWVRAQGEPVLGAGGELIKVSGTFQDITDLKRREVALQRLTKILRESRDRLELALDSMNMGVWDLSLIDDTLIWDERMFQIFGETPTNSMSGKLIWQRSLHPDDYDRFYQEIATSIKNESSEYRSECRIVRSDGLVRNIKVVAQIVRDAKGNAIRLVGVNWDFTEEEMKNEELLQQRKMAQHNAKLAAIGELAAGVAHEINNPLTIINGFVNLLGKHISDGSWDKQRMLEVVGKIDTSSDRIASIVRGLRNFSRVDAESLTKFDIVEIIDETLSMLHGIYHQEGVSVQFNFDRKKAIYIDGNRGKIQQVLINLISNAKDATAGQSHRKIIVQLFEENGKVRLRVEDNGPGIPEELRERIFEPFFTTKDVNKGTGIGLSLVHSIVAEHNGIISIDEKQKQGASFTVELPSVHHAA